MKLCVALAGILVSICLCSMSWADPAYLPAIGVAGKRASIGTVRSEAHVTVSDGLEFDVVTLFHDRQRAILRQIHSDRTVTLGVDGRYYWHFDGEKEEEGPPLYEVIVLGHQFHAQILFFDRLNGPLEPGPESACGEGRCRSLTGANGNSLAIDMKTGLPVEFIIPREGEPDVRSTFSEWREVDGVRLPFHVTIDDGSRLFEYTFATVSFNEGSLDAFRAPVELLTDEQKLLRRHRITMDAHLFEDAGMLAGSFAPEVTMVSAGEIHRTTGADAEAMMAGIFSNRDYTRYDDLVRPIVRVSDDGTLGWVIVQVDAEGVRLDEQGNVTEPLAFTSAWISLFEKVGDAWKMSGNVSNFK